ncbi:MAG: dienelactone hydrolase family protein, partial [Pirellulaceae bacterium]|nr:dienelactone hydrolase family protein [Pirellulaceae bacterium]
MNLTNNSTTSDPPRRVRCGDFRLPAALLIAAATIAGLPATARSQELPGGAKLLKMEGDIASAMVDGADRFLLRQLEQSIEKRAAFWKRDFTSPREYALSVSPNRVRLSHILGIRDPRVEFTGLQLEGATDQPALLGRGDGFKAFAVSWPVIRDIQGIGVLLEPTEHNGIDIIAIPDADQTPEMIAGLAEGLPAESQFARRLAESGCRVVCPALVNRHLERRNGRATLTSREFVHRSAFELGRHIAGYELQKVFALVDWARKRDGLKAKVGVVGWGEGGMLALYAGALDSRIRATAVSGYFDSRQSLWSQPIDRNVYALFEQFGDAEIASLVAPRALVIDASKGPELKLDGSGGGAPAELKSPPIAAVKAEFARAEKMIDAYPKRAAWTLRGDGAEPGVSSECLADLLKALGGELKDVGDDPQTTRPAIDVKARQARMIHQIDDHNQWLLRESSFKRQAFMKDLDTSSLGAYKRSVESYRENFKNEVIGSFDIERLPFNPRARKAYETDKWTGYEVVLDVFPDVIAFGVLLEPKGIKPGEKRPVVVCQHGLEGRPKDVIEGDHRAYHDFAAKLAERGFVTFAPQNIYIFRDRFRTLQRKSYPIKKTIFSIMVPQHQQITDWLKTLPYVDGERIAFYGLSYGGKSAMRIPPLVDNYCLSICSADFNEWVRKNASTRENFSYVWTGEYEIFEWDLGSTFNYAEMAGLIAPRPFMVERGHYDGVASDETVGWEFAKVRFLYQGKLKLPGRCEIEWFDGPHTINGKGTYDFLH